MSESIHDKLKRVRKPRVHITYDVEGSDGQSNKELPFVVGVMGDYSGDNEDKKAYKDRSFVQVDRDNFNEFMSKGVKPKLDMKVDNTLVDGDKQFAVNLEFDSLEDFEPQNIVKQVKPLNELLEARNKLRDLLSKADRSEKLESVLEDILQNTESSLSKLSDELDIKSSDDKGDE